MTNTRSFTPRFWRRAPVAILAVVVCAWTAPIQSAPARIFAIGDIHGAHDSLVTILTATGLANAQLQWSGGTATLVQTGDFTDRGAAVRQVMDLLIALEGQARKAGGQVVTLLGNHEVMNLLGDYRDVNPEACLPFADAQSERRREDAWKQFSTMAAARLKARPTATVYQQTREAWMAAHPPGCLEYREAFGTRGTYGRWLRGKRIATVIDGTLFMHAGLNPEQPPASVDAVIERAKSELERFDRFRQRLLERKMASPSMTLQEIVQIAAAEIEHTAGLIEAAKAKGEAPDFAEIDLALAREAVEITKIGEWSLLAPEGPLWFRGWAQSDEAATTPHVDAFFKQLTLTRVVVAHTPQRTGEITPRYAGRAMLIDTGMLTSVYKGRPSALRIDGAALTAVYPDREVPLSASSPAADRF